MTHSEETYVAVIAAAIPVGGIFWDWLTEARLECCYDYDPIKRAEFEGARKFAEKLQLIATPQSQGD